MDKTRAQAYTLEGIIAAILITAAVVLGFQAVDVAPWTSGPDDSSIDSLQTQTADALAVAADNGTLTRAVTCLDGDEPDTDAYVRSSDESATEFGPLLDDVLYDNGYRYNVYLRYQNRTGITKQILVHPDSARSPQSGGVTVTRRVVLYDSMRASTLGTCYTKEETLTELNDSNDIYVPDRQDNSEVYNVVEVVVEVW